MIHSRPAAIPALLLIALSTVVCAGASAADDETIALGKKVFTELAQPSCTICHKLKDAGSEGELGPALDEMKPSVSRVRTAVAGGVGAMPAFENLTQEQIDAVAAYVASVTGAAASN
jgi:mono/diheme cytochrome c family protein